MSSRSMNSEYTSNSAMDDDSSSVHDSDHYSPSNPNHREGRRKRPQSGNNAIKSPVKSVLHTQPTKIGRVLRTEGNGDSFVVAATEKKKRHYPKKAVEETPEEVLEKARNERRNQAMARLLERREESQALQIKNKEAKRIAALTKQAHSPTESRPQIQPAVVEKVVLPRRGATDT
eukprot:gene45716-56966_t